MSNNKQQTAVEWLEQEMLKPNLSMKEILKQAKEMERQQIKSAYFQGWGSEMKTSEQYYEQTYGNNHIGDANEMVGGEQ